MKLGIIFGVIVVAFIGIFALMYISYNNEGARLEQSLVAARENASNIATQYQNTLMEQIQVPDMMKDHIAELIKASIEGRYGENGSRAIFQSITEQNPTVDPAIYITIQRVIEEGRTKFEREQTRMIDIKRVYETKLRSMPSGFFLRLTGYPTLDLNEFKPVTTNRVREMLETGTDEHIKFK